MAQLQTIRIPPRRSAVVLSNTGFVSAADDVSAGCSVSLEVSLEFSGLGDKEIDGSGETTEGSGVVVRAGGMVTGSGE